MRIGAPIRNWEAQRHKGTKAQRHRGGRGDNHGFHGWARMAQNLDRDLDLDPDPDLKAWREV